MCVHDAESADIRTLRTNIKPKINTKLENGILLGFVVDVFMNKQYSIVIFVKICTTLVKLYFFLELGTLKYVQ